MPFEDRARIFQAVIAADRAERREAGAYGQQSFFTIHRATLMQARLCSLNPSCVMCRRSLCGNLELDACHRRAGATCAHMLPLLPCMRKPRCSYQGYLHLLLKRAGRQCHPHDTSAARQRQAEMKLEGRVQPSLACQSGQVPHEGAALHKP